MVAAHRIQGYPHGLLLLFNGRIANPWLLLLLFFSLGYHFAALSIVPTAVPANHVGQNRVAAAVAVGILTRLEMQMAPPRALAGMGGSSLRYGHGEVAF
jgi:hypothetical protein